MPYETLILTREESFAVITLNRPPANAISIDLMQELNAALSDVESDPAVRSVIITGAGDRIFCAGADLGNAFSGPDVASFIRFGNSVVRRIERFPKPVVAAINGHALGGGCEIAMGCHIRILKETARMGQTESNLGITPGYGGTQRFPRLVGRGVALEHLILGTQIPAQECYRIGLANRLSKEGETLNDAKALEDAGISVSDEAEAILGGAVSGADKPGVMGMMARQIANAGINVRAAYVATDNRVVMVTDNNAKLMELMANM